MNMRLIGARNIQEIVPEMVDASALSSHVGITPSDNLYNGTCKTIYLSTKSLPDLLIFARSTIGHCQIQGCQALIALTLGVACRRETLELE